MAFIKDFSSKAIGSHRGANLYELDFFIRKKSTFKITLTATCSQLAWYLAFNKTPLGEIRK